MAAEPGMTMTAEPQADRAAADWAAARAERACIELAMYVRMLDDAQRLSDYLKRVVENLKRKILFTTEHKIIHKPCYIRIFVFRIR